MLQTKQHPRKIVQTQIEEKRTKRAATFLAETPLFYFEPDQLIILSTFDNFQ
jgi:hypothetical protein